MAEAVRGRMAAALSIPLHAIGAKELRREAQAAVAARRGAG